ncbi:MAG TPA: hydroxymethylglutaryl-CoA lyase [Acidimicrobiales bacterium]|nr:hydroxymethylglutaryl-CoA lyase [Acidimicrobiales bacterium]
MDPSLGAVRVGGLASRVTIYEVGPRDGLQNEARVVDVAVKAEFIDRLASAGLAIIEATSMVDPRWVPQLADAEDLLDRLDLNGGVRHPVLVPNERGLERALAKGVTEIAVFASATETFAQRNQNRSVADTLHTLSSVVSHALDLGLRVRGYVSMCFGDPWEGDVQPASVVAVGRTLLEMGCEQLSLGDTIGAAAPGKVLAVLDAFDTAQVSRERLAMHFHDTYGQALANIFAALSGGITTFDASAGGLGGCPFAKRASGNVATEDLVWMLHGLGIETGVDLATLVATSRWMAVNLGRPSTSRVVQSWPSGDE